jgi:4-cresol dehydrogenase (hydroxylating)
LLMNKLALEQALNDWRAVLGTEAVLTDSSVLARYGVCTTPTNRFIPAVLCPRTVREVQDIVIVAGRYRVPLYPISTGHNWGYGSANPVVDGCVVVDLSNMNRILDFDVELGVVTLEPGVTQQQLSEYIEQNGLPFLVPVTGAGPFCSLVGNALDRGYGITPYADHFGAVTALEAVLADGGIYRPALTELGGSSVDRAYKWGVGPYLDGLFAQGGVGIVTQMTIALAPRPEKIKAFFFSVVDEEGLEPAVAAIRNVLRSMSGITGSINLMNAERVLSMMVPYPHEAVRSGVIPPQTIAELAKRHRVTTWTGVAAIYGDARLVEVACSVIKAKLRSHVQRLRFLNSGTVSRLQRLLDFLPAKHTAGLVTKLNKLNDALCIMEGRPSEIALPLAYWKSGILPSGGVGKDPARDGCGLIWYAPLVPMKPEKVRLFVEMVRRICPAYGIDPLITLTSLSDRCFDGTVPLLFRRDDAEGAAKAQACYRALFEAGQEEGFVPYRMSVNSMPLITGQKNGFWDTVSKIKHALDPDSIIAPGRYSRLP